MNEREILDYLQQLSDEDKYQEIIDYIDNLPEEQRTPLIISDKGRAYNNVYWFIEGENKDLAPLHSALDAFLSVQDALQQQDIWHYRIGYTYTYLNQLDKAREHLNRSLELGFRESGIVAELLFFIDVAEQQQIPIERVVQGGIADVEYVFNYFMQVLRKNAEPLFKTFNSGLSASEVDAFEQQLDVKFPEQMHYIYQTFNGQINGSRLIDGLPFGQWLSLQDIVHTQQHIIARLERIYGENWQKHKINPMQFNDPDEIKNRLYDRQWLPIFTYDEQRFLCIDLDPNPENGVIGQLFYLNVHEDLEHYDIRWVSWRLSYLLKDLLLPIIQFDPEWRYDAVKNCYVPNDDRFKKRD